MIHFQCPDCHIPPLNPPPSAEEGSQVRDACPQCHRSFAAVNGVIDGLPKQLSDDHFKNTEQRFWDFAYASGPGIDHAPGYLEFHKHFLSKLRALGPGARVLEIAAGTRGDGLRLMASGVHVVETDISPVALRKLAERYYYCHSERSEESTTPVGLASASDPSIPLRSTRDDKSKNKFSGILSLRGAPATWQSLADARPRTGGRSLDLSRLGSSQGGQARDDKNKNQINNNSNYGLRVTDYGLPTFVAADAEHLPFPDQTFDGVFVAASFHHLPNPTRGLQEMARVTKPGGVVIVAIEPNHWPYKFIYKPLRPIKRWIRARRARPVDSIADDTTAGFRKRDLIKLFHAADLEIVEIRPVKFLLEFLDSGTRLLSLIVRRPLMPPAWLQRPLARFDYWLGKIPGLEHIAWHWTIIGKTKNPLVPKS